MIRLARESGADESTCDQVGIAMANINALVFARALGDDAFQCVPRDTDELDRALSSGKIVVMGGLQPGQSTNAVAAIAAETVGADLLINATDVDGVYTSDPKTDPKAKRLEEITVKELLAAILKEEVSAGGYKLFDPVAVKIIGRSRIPTLILNASDPENLIRAVEGGKVGTRVVF